MANLEIPTWDQHISRVEKFLLGGGKRMPR
jgi:hypothetical protein